MGDRDPLRADRWRGACAGDRPDPFSLADPAAVQSILAAAGFVDVGITDVREPVCYGPDAPAAFDLVRDMRMTRDLLARLDAVAAQRALARLRETLAAHETLGGVLFDSRAWIVIARRAGDVAPALRGKSSKRTLR